jgi:hypothetical protein
MKRTEKPQNLYTYCLDELPEEIIRAIFKYLSDTDVFTNLRLVNRTLKQIVDDYLIGNFVFKN